MKTKQKAKYTASIEICLTEKQKKELIAKAKKQKISVSKMVRSYLF